MDTIAAVEVVRKHLEAGAPGEGVSIYLWDHPSPGVGVRVAEVSFVVNRADGGISGASYMQSDPDGLMVCAAVERAIVELMEGDDRDEGEDSEVNRQLWLLDFIIKPKACPREGDKASSPKH